MPKDTHSYSEVLMEFEKCQKVLNGFTNFDDPIETVTTEKLEYDARRLISLMDSYPSCIEYTSLNKMLAILCLMNDREVQAVYHLIESHAVLLHLQVQHRYNKTETRKKLLEEQQRFGLNPAHFKLNAINKPEDCGPALKARLSEFPEEWYMVQLTAQYEPSDKTIFNDSEIQSMLPLHISVLPTGNNGMNPLCITVPKPKMTVKYDICKEINEILASNKVNLEAEYPNYKLYWKMRDKQNERLKGAIFETETRWLREWRVLLMADPIEELSLVEDVRNMIDKLLADNKSFDHVSERTRWLLHKIALGACFLTRDEIAMAVKYTLPFDDKLSGNVIYSIYGRLSQLTLLRSAKRKTLVLIVDEILDHISFEMMDILQKHPVTRFPSMHVAYALYKEHEDTIENGCKVIKMRKNTGSFIVNPSNNLPELEKRMRVFNDYWLPHWTGSYNVYPDAETFESALTNYDILMYNGHGSGIQYLSGERIEKLRVTAIVLLFGCASAKLYPVGGRFPPIGVSNQYLIACSPCVLGMLWDVTDGDVDRLTVNLLSNWIPSSAPRPWSDVKMSEWIYGKIEFMNSNLENRIASLAVSDRASIEPEMLRALAQARVKCVQYMTMAAPVVRGLPIKIKEI